MSLPPQAPAFASVEPQVFELLVYLIANRGSITILR
jgi:hypothetical protein